jgi:hypothetical protein
LRYGSYLIDSILKLCKAISHVVLWFEGRKAEMELRQRQGARIACFAQPINAMEVIQLEQRGGSV